MKNFPDQDPFNELERRLEGYTEQPDELVWKNIDAALRPDRTAGWVPWMDRATTVVAIVLFGLAVVAMESGGVVNREDMAKKSDATSSAESEAVVSSDNAFGAQSSVPLQSQDGVNENQNLERTAAEESGKRTNVKKAEKKEQHLSSASLQAGEMNTNKPSSASTSIGEKMTTANDNPMDSAVDSSVLLQMDSSISKETGGVKESKRIPKRTPAFYFTTTPMLSFQRIVPVSRDGVVVSEFSDRPILSAERFGISVDAGVQGFLAKRFEYFAGLSIYQQRQTLQYTYQNDEQVMADSNGENQFIITPKTSQATISYEMINLGAHAGILYHLYGKMLTHKFGAGMLFQQGFKKADGETYNNAESSYLSYQIFYRNELRLSPRLRFFVQPTFVQSIRADEKLDAPFNIKPYRAGLGFGILYDFQKSSLKRR